MPNPKIIHIEIGSNELCSYGCGKRAEVAFANGKFCCETTSNKCEFVKNRNANSLKRSYASGQRKPTIFSNETKLRIAESVSRTKQKNKPFLEWEQMSFSMKRKEVLKEQNNQCLVCKNVEWMGQKIKLEVDHIDGIKSNNNRDNLRALCPNCHSFTDTWRKKKSAGSPTAGGTSLRNCTV